MKLNNKMILNNANFNNRDWFFGVSIFSNLDIKL